MNWLPICTSTRSRTFSAAFPGWNPRRHTQVRASRKSRHFGRDAEIQAMDGSQSVVQVLDSGNLPARSVMDMDTRTPVAAHSLPSLDAGFRHPCRKDGPPTLVYNDKIWSLGTRTKGPLGDFTPSGTCVDDEHKTFPCLQEPATISLKDVCPKPRNFQLPLTTMEPPP